MNELPTAREAVEEYAKNQTRLEFHDQQTFVLLNTLLQLYGYTLMPTRGSVSEKTIAILKRIEDGEGISGGGQKE